MKPLPGQGCPCGSGDLTRFYFTGWRCPACAPSEAAVRANAIARATRRDSARRERAVPPPKETR